MDLATLIGLLLGVGCVVGSFLMEGGNFAQLINIPAGIIVFGGTFGAAMASSPLRRVVAMPVLFRHALFTKPHDASEIIQSLVNFALKARREGLLVLEADAKEINDPFLQSGLQLAIDGTDPELVRDILRTDLEFVQERHKEGADLFKTLGGFAPTLGIIGTVMGLIHMLGQMSEPGKMGPAIAAAFIATLYGVCSANLLYIPISNKLKVRSAEEVLLREIMIEGILSIQAGDNPRIVEEKLKAFLPPKERAAFSAQEGGAVAMKEAA
jgi:chemotaxis protein MotA